MFRIYKTIITLALFAVFFMAASAFISIKEASAAAGNYCFCSDNLDRMNDDNYSKAWSACVSITGAPAGAEACDNTWLSDHSLGDWDTCQFESDQTACAGSKSLYDSYAKVKQDTMGKHKADTAPGPAIAGNFCYCTNNISNINKNNYNQKWSACLPIAGMGAGAEQCDPAFLSDHGQGEWESCELKDDQASCWDEQSVFDQAVKQQQDMYSKGGPGWPQYCLCSAKKDSFSECIWAEKVDECTATFQTKSMGRQIDDCSPTGKDCQAAGRFKISCRPSNIFSGLTGGKSHSWSISATAFMAAS